MGLTPAGSPRRPRDAGTEPMARRENAGAGRRRPRESYGRFLLRLGLKEAVWFGDYCRFREVGEVAAALSQRPIESLLDVGCAGTLFPHYVARLFPGAAVVGIDNEENLALAAPQIENLARRAAAGGRVRLFPADARALPFCDNRFDAATAVSVLEHIRGDGDVRAAVEMARVTRPGGLVVFSVPMAAEAIEQEADSSCPYFIRRYDRTALEERLIGPTRARRAKIRYFGERIAPYSRLYIALRRIHERLCARSRAWKPVRWATWAALALTPAASRIFLHVWDADSPSAGRAAAPGGAVVVLEMG